MRILLTGKDGQLGEELQALLPAVGMVKAVGRAELDLTQPDAIRQLIRDVEPSLIINAAAYTAVDKAESELELAQAINGTAPTVMAEEAQSLGATLMHISTDYVFDGQKNTPYLESDPTSPLGAYGTSKLAGEEGIREQCDRHLILRTAWVYGNGGKGNFVKTMLRLGQEREELKVVVDQVGSPTWTGDLGQAILQFVGAMEGDRVAQIAGTYHVTNSGAISWYDFATAIFEEAAHLGFPLRIQRVLPITTAEYPTPAKRPAYSVLSQQKTAALLGKPQPHWRQGLRQMLANIPH
ncbi:MULTISPECIES: dTDP-4-dehydrorhamnose reductase [unclassified Leptolyngbya]|uniref:dTDP-4-dehydrorhamnose reductase n=1 Tax=unclassified Leptolyngbya TaxID=2650499 RepID=UPI001681E265|nr:MULTISPECIES: dTDP-4-dehydrorhamnose reductase [unclassified Leptolyngbya]MBD1911553.1 dTDP-4-dehydrorhamnose reductase [Leptolyngbya sp. FACHB-8]MBD2155587.1 dTDP-4-dehydrorhamnose reductase [Leptolyngbya sp. FACHB-16]